MKRILIFGAGSIGNHMSYACSQLGYKIYITDKDSLALKRMKNVIYPKRYGKWNMKINQINYSDVYKLTVGNHGFSNSLFHIDNHHLSSDVIPEIEKNW